MTTWHAESMQDLVEVTDVIHDSWFDIDDVEHDAEAQVLEGLNSKIRLISHRAFGFHSADPLIALVYLCCGNVTIPLPR